ncbi:MAG TPA: hypothetical protein VGI39_42965 [Polyangiaceae bacterium]|jgi:hypothetical protein
MSPELLESLRDESERTTVRLPVRPPFAPDEESIDAAPSPPPPLALGKPEGPMRSGTDEVEEVTRPYVPSKTLLRGKRSKAR